MDTTTVKDKILETLDECIPNHGHDDDVIDILLEEVTKAIKVNNTVTDVDELTTKLVDVYYDFADPDAIAIAQLCEFIINTRPAPGGKNKGKGPGKEKGKGKGMTRKERRAAELAAAKAAREEAYREASKDAAVVSFSNTNTKKLLTTEDIKVEGFTIMMAGKTLLKDVSLTLARGRRYGLVGYNGTGKSTLLRLLAKQKEDFQIPPHIDVLYVEQEIVATEKTALEFVLDADAERSVLMAEVAFLEDENNELDQEQLEAAGERLQELYDRLELIGADSARGRASAILSGLQFTEEMKRMPVTEFSGGWRMRCSLARALFLRPRLLLLDEPTNHLDLHACIWLEGYLAKWKNTLLVVSHDRDFLNGVCTDIIHLWQCGLRQHKGDFDQFEKVFVSVKDEAQKAYDQQTKLIKKWKKEGKRVDEMLERTHQDLLERPKDYNVRVSFPDPGPLPTPVLNVKDVSFRYNDDSPYLFERESFGLSDHSRIALVGANGTGKSTLLKLLAGELAPTAGSVERNPSLRLGVFSQHAVEQLDLTKTPIEYIQQKFDLDYQDTRKYLGTIGLKGSQHEQLISTLSGGQKARVMLVELQLMEPHVLLLDEPTNNLDMETNVALAEALAEFPGSVLLVTHNMHLISSVCNEVWLCGEDEAKVMPYDGGFEEYCAEMLADMQELLEDV